MAKKRSKSKQSRVQFRKRYQGRVREGDLTRQFNSGDTESLADAVKNERVSGKGELTRKRTVAGADANMPTAAGNQGDAALIDGRVVRAHGLSNTVLADDGRRFDCAIRQVLKSISIEGRGTVVAGDRVRFRAESDSTGMIEFVAPRHGVISRQSRGQQHIIAANVDHLLIVTSAAEPSLKPSLVDRFLLTAQQCDVKPVIVINKCDLVDCRELQPMVGVYASLGFRVLLTSAEQGINIEYLRELLRGKQTALSGQSGVGKSSLLNAVQPGLGLAVAAVSQDNQKGRHTTTTSTLIPLEGDSVGAVFDTPGIRQFQLWDITAEEVAGLMPDLRPHVGHCRYANCLHLNEDGCAVKNAVADGKIDPRRYDSYCHLLEEDLLASGY
ncbi:ribosome small subunit-dependent GTPase A [Rhodopirellula sp. MGV]|uniref:ribosome small subunit-dependent GTPase A n=1 Tax=Rhodopirellula sp. MGV TaxID=2023130 RepID=UPI000B95F93A|nr:ribosome small subunit-dependent GTPase A [Rhodopirellula sp. MGV]OYP32221.1 ribosome small subunit-dependent GTPase A [Rhodopirellula sp. MGV]PNY37689.1 ribosome small subunit-dependent GTPase A [Rhodopirellula baltica]